MCSWINLVGYMMSRYESNPILPYEEQNCGVSQFQGQEEELLKPDSDIRQLINLRTEPTETIRKTTNNANKDAPVSVVKMLLAREANYFGKGKFSHADRCHVLNRYLPVDGPWHVDKMDSRAYISQFSRDGSLFIAGFQGSRLRVYDVDNGWKIKKDIIARNLRWTFTDTSLSPNEEYLVYACMSPIVNIVKIGSGALKSYANITEIHESLDFSMQGYDYGEHSFGIFSIKFSTDGRELVAGCSDNSISVYDLEANKPALRINAHSSDVNTVAFADETGQILYSGSDDNLCKVWDRRCFVGQDHPSGVLVGHLEGITFLDSRGDGRYLISNGKDQAIKLWDIRKMSNTSNYTRPETYQWDYRWMEYPNHARQFRHAHDQSLATYKGHSILRTLIRCYFSPAYSTGQKYIYTGSADFSVYIYDVVSGDQVGKLSCHESTVRDCSWHPYYPMLVSSSWDGLVARWEFSGNSEQDTCGRWGNRDLQY